MVELKRFITALEPAILALAMTTFIHGLMDESDFSAVPNGPARAKELWEAICGPGYDRPPLQLHEPKPESENGRRPRNFRENSIRAQYFELEGVGVYVFACEVHYGVAVGFEFLSFVHDGQIVRQLVMSYADVFWIDVPPDQFMAVTA
jgi:hypothetical protein